MRHPLTRFVVIVLAWLPVCFAVWYFTAPLLSRFIAFEYITAQAAARRAQNVMGGLACMAGT